LQVPSAVSLFPRPIAPSYDFSVVLARVGRTKRSALRRIVFERRGYAEGFDRYSSSYGFAQAAVRELLLR